MKRIQLLDDIRGFCMISVLAFHTIWDMVFLFDVNWMWIYGTAAYVWQQSVSWTFIFLSGFCWSMGKRKLRRGIYVFGAGFLVSLVTELVMPDERVRFGILTLLGTCMLLMILLEKVTVKIPEWWGFLGSILCFLLIRNINEGYLGFEQINLVKLPDQLYHLGDIGSFIGFTEKEFYSTDYFSIFPWIFLFIAGYFGYRIAQKKNLLEKMHKVHFPGKILAVLGRNSLIIYMLHQPVIYLVLCILQKISPMGA